MAKKSKIQGQENISDDNSIITEENLVLMVKDEQEIEVHESCVKAHELKGWITAAYVT